METGQDRWQAGVIDYAPMEGITTYIYRRLHHRYFPGVDAYYIPFISPSQNHEFTHKDQRELDPANNVLDGARVVPQLMGRNAEDFLWAAERIASLGYDEVNLNVGCPSGTVCAKGKGAGMLADPPALERFLDAVCGRTIGLGLKLSVKTRLGIRSEEEFGKILEIYNRMPLERIIIHPRVRCDYYREPVRMDCFRQSLPLSRHPVIYNGEIRSVTDAEKFSKVLGISADVSQAWSDTLYRTDELQRQSELDETQLRWGESEGRLAGIMIGRGLAANPALARQLRGGAALSKAELRRFMDELYEAYAEAYGQAGAAQSRMKDLWAHTITSFEGEGAERAGRRILKARSREDYRAAVSRLFDEMELR